MSVLTQQIAPSAMEVVSIFGHGGTLLKGRLGMDGGKEKGQPMANFYSQRVEMLPLREYFRVFSIKRPLA
jgi:hypothetical protein